MGGRVRATPAGLTRRTVLRGVGVPLALLTDPYAGELRPARRPATASERGALELPADGVPVAHDRFVASLERDAERRIFLAQIRQLLLDTAEACVQDEGAWVVPGPNYPQSLYCRDSFWLAAALQNPTLSSNLISLLAEEEGQYGDGQIPTAIYYDRWFRTPQRDDESMLLFVLHCLLQARLGGDPPLQTLERVYGFVASHVTTARYVTRGETRVGPEFSGRTELGAFHYWADTYRPMGRAEPAPAVFAYNQGLYCLALRGLCELGLSVSPEVLPEAEAVYADMRSTRDDRSLPQREGASVVDVSALAPEALSFYFFDRPLLGAERVRATLGRLAATRYPDGSFLGFKVISDFGGDYRPLADFTGNPANDPGSYHNGGSWLLYDALALYAGARHGVEGCAEMLMERLASEVSRSWASHEYLITDRRTPGQRDPTREGYGWNAFVAALLA